MHKQVNEQITRKGNRRKDTTKKEIVKAKGERDERRKGDCREDKKEMKKGRKEGLLNRHMHTCRKREGNNEIPEE